MTMKTKKTLHRFAAVAAVLLAFCLVFATPVGAAEVTGGTGEALANAISSAGAGETVTLTEDVTVSQGIILTKDVTINLEDHKITYDGDDVLFTVNAGNLTINAGKSGEIISSGKRIIELDTKEPASLTVIGGTYSQEGDSSNAVFVISLDSYCEKKSTITDATILCNYNCFEVSGYADVTLEDCVISTTKEVPSTSGYLHAIIASYGGTVHVKGGSVTSEGIALASFHTNGKITVEDATITGSAAALQAMPADSTTDEYPYKTGKSSIVVSSGTVNGPITTKEVKIDESTLAYDAGSGGTTTIAIKGGTFTVSDADSLKTIINALADDGDGKPETRPVIQIAGPITVEEQLEIRAPVKIVGDGDTKPTITCSVKKLFEVHANADFKNLDLVNNAYDGRCIDTRVGGITVNINDCELTATNKGSYYTQPLTIGGSGIDASGNKAANIVVNLNKVNIEAKHYGIITYNPVDLTITDSSITGYAALYFKGPDSSVGSSGSIVKINGKSTIKGINSASLDPSNAFGTFVFESGGVEVTLNDADVAHAISNTGNSQHIFSFYRSTGNTVTINSGVTMSATGGSDYFVRPYQDIAGDNQNTVITNAGVTSNFPIDSKYLADGCECVGSGNSWTVQIQTFSVQFDSKEGTTVGSKSIEYGNPVVRPADPTKEGYTFAGWYLDEMLYDFTTPVTDDITLTAKWNKNGEAVTVTPTISVEITVDQNSQTTICVPAEDAATTVEFSDPENAAPVAVITDKTTGVQMEVTFAEGAEEMTDGSVSGTVTSVEVKYPEAPAESEGDIKQKVNFVMNNPDDKDKLPKIDSKKDDTVVEKVKKQEQRANVLAMITATHEKLAEINNNITEVKITFKVHASLISNSEFVKAYHVKGDTVDVLPDDNITIAGPDGGFYTITITSDKKFSSYVLAEEIPQTTSSGSATDTGSGNYQYYPRDVPADGIVSFGTSKVVTGMELPAGSSGKVTLNIKPDFAMPENGFYAFEIDAPGYNTDAKINGGLSFQIPVADLEAAGWTAEDIVLFHGTVAEDGTITWEALPTNLVKNENGVAYYKAAINGCSPFYIGFVKDGSVVNTEVIEPVTPDTPDTPVTPDEPEVLPPVDTPDTPEQPAESPAPILGMVLGGLAAAVVLRRK